METTLPPPARSPTAGQPHRIASPLSNSWPFFSLQIHNNQGRGMGSWICPATWLSENQLRKLQCAGPAGANRRSDGNT